VISDEEAAKIRQKVDEGWRVPVLLTRRQRALVFRPKRL